MIKNMHELPEDVQEFFNDLKKQITAHEWENLPEMLGFADRRSWKWVLKGDSPWPRTAIIKLAAVMDEDPADLFCRHPFFWKKVTIDDAQKIAHEAGNELFLTTEPHAA